MSRLLRFAVVLILLAAFPAGPTLALDPVPLEVRLVRFVADRVGDPDARIEVASLPFESDDAELEARFSIHPRQRLAGAVPVRVSITKSGRQVRSFVVTVNVHAQTKIWVARRHLVAGATLSADDLALESRPSASLPRDVVTDASAIIGRRMRRAVAPGVPIRNSATQSTPDVKRGDVVKLVLKRGPLAIESSGRAQEDGRLGDWIRARNITSRRTVIGRVSPNGELHVRP